MENNYKPYSTKSIHHHSENNLFYNYVYKFNCQPNYFESSNPLKLCVVDNLEKKGAKIIFRAQYEKKNYKSQQQVKNCWTLEYKDAFIDLGSDYDIDIMRYIDDEDEDEPENEEQSSCENRVFCKVLYQKEETLTEIKETFKYIEEKKQKNIYLMVKMDGGLSIKRFDVKLPEKEINLELNYGKELQKKEKILLKSLEQNKSGLVLFSGMPGTGKSTFIKYLSSKTNRKIIYLPSNTAEELTSPSFLEFMMRHKNCILLLEDAEKVLMSRESQDNPAISNILNLTDGFLGDCFNIFIIATFNTSKEKIDTALLRKGRLILEHQFDEIPPENCNEIFKNIGSSRTTEVPLTLAEIYNEQDNFAVVEEKNKIGF